MKEKNIHFATIFSYQFFKITNSVRSKQTKRLVLQLISEGRNSLHAYASIIQKIQDFKLLHWDLHFNHTFREGNMCADELAKTGSSLQCNLQVFNGCPPFITQLVLADRKGAQYIRHQLFFPLFFFFPCTKKKESVVTHGCTRCTVNYLHKKIWGRNVFHATYQKIETQKRP